MPLPRFAIWSPGRVFLGGHSYGGRQSTMLCADQPGLVDGLLLLSYPLHPPRKPDQLRVQHLPKLQTPALFVHGTRDPFGSPEEMEAALSLIPAKTRLRPDRSAQVTTSVSRERQGRRSCPHSCSRSFKSSLVKVKVLYQRESVKIRGALSSPSRISIRHFSCSHHQAECSCHFRRRSH